MSRKTALILLILVVVAGVGLRSYRLTARSLWFDEAFSWRLVQFPFSEMIARDARDVHPPLYYIVLRGWTTVFGTSLLAIRSFSVTLAGATVAAAYLFAASAFRSRTTGLLAAALIAFSGWQIAFAWEARMYTLGTFLVLLSSWLLIRATRATYQRLWLWILYAVVVAAFAYIHYFAFFTLAAHALFVVGSIVVRTKWRVGEILQLRLTWYALVAAVVAVLLYLPWVPAFLNQHSQVQRQYWVPDIGGWSVPDTFYRMLIPTAGIPAHTGGGAIVTLLPMIVIALLWMMLVVAYEQRSGSQGSRGAVDAAWLTVVCAALPFVFSIGISLIGQSLYQDRFLVFAQVFVLIGIAALVMRVPWRVPRVMLTAVIVLGFVTVFARFWIELDVVNRPGARAATSYVVAHRLRDEPVIVSSPFVYFTVLYYAQEEYKEEFMPKLYLEAAELLHFAGGPIVTQEDVVGPSIFNSADTIWVVDTSGFGSGNLQLPGEWDVKDRQIYDEVFAHQGQVFVTKYTTRNS